MYGVNIPLIMGGSVTRSMTEHIQNIIIFAQKENDVIPEISGYWLKRGQIVTGAIKTSSNIEI